MSIGKNPLHPGPYVKENVIPKNVSVSDAAKILGLSRPALSNFLNGKSALSSQMAARLEKAFGAKKDELLRMQQAYEAQESQEAEQKIAVRTYSPFFLDIRAMNIAAWAEKMDTRPQLPALLRRLVHTTGATITQSDFPAFDLSQRHGWDGYVDCESPNPWVPDGVSGWEFGCDANPTKKANEDFAARSKLPDAERLNTTFIFVTPRHWPKKAEWVAAKRQEGKWKGVRAYDANDIEQWMENSPPAQAWLAGILGIPTEGCQTLTEYWRSWAGVADPAISPKIFKSLVEKNIDQIEAWLKGEDNSPLIISAASKEEGVAFLAAATQLSDKLTVFGQQAVFFDLPQPMKKLAGITSELIPVIYSGDLERTVIEAFPGRKVVIVADKNVGPNRQNIEVGPPNYESFQEAIKDMALDELTDASIIRGSNRSPTILRRLLARTPGLKKPSWAQNAEHAKWMIPFVLLGRWKWGSASDREIISYVADKPADVVERRILELNALDDAPILREGDVGGVASRLECLNAVADLISEQDMERFFFVAECVLEEDDPSLDLEKSKRWSAAIYGKVREYSGTMRRSIANSLILLSVHGPRVLGNELGPSVEWKVATLIKRLLKDREPRVWLSQQSDLPSYAEAAPDVFLNIVQDELRKPEPAFGCLFEPVESGPFSSCDRTGMLWGLEVLAWNPVRLNRVITILADLCRYRIEDNWVNKPEGSIRDILLSWRPHTLASLDQRIEVLDSLCTKFPEVGWSFCMSQVDAMHSMTSGTYEPRWRDEACEGDRILTNKDVFDFQRKCLDLLLAWPKYDREKIEGLINLLGDVPKEDRDQIHRHIDTWLAGDPPQEDIADLREHVRTRTMTRRARRNNKRPEGVADGQRLFARLEPTDLLLRHRWLFAKQWVEYSGDEIHAENLDHDAREKWITEERARSLREILDQLGNDGVFKLCSMAESANVVGWTLTQGVLSREELVTILTIAVTGDAKFNQAKLDQFASGILHRFVDDELVEFLDDAARALDEGSNADLRLRLHLLAPFCQANWDMVSALGRDAEQEYWRKVNVSWLRSDEAGFNFCVEKLLSVDRPRAAFWVSHFDHDKLRTKTLMAMLRDMGTKDTEPAEHFRPQSHDIVSAFEALEGRDDVDTSELVRLEFMYVRAIGSHSGFKFTNLSREVANSPQSFFHLIALCFRREDHGEDDPALELPTNDEQRRNAAEMAHSALDNVTHIPGTQADGSVNVDQLREWVHAVRNLARKHDRLAIADQQIGSLLQRCGVGSDGIWPRVEVRQVLEEVASDEIATGLSIEERNSRGSQWRPSPDNGNPERELAAKYRGYGEAVMNRTPFVARILFGIAESYERDARYHDGEGRRREWFPD